MNPVPRIFHQEIKVIGLCFEVEIQTLKRAFYSIFQCHFVQNTKFVTISNGTSSKLYQISVTNAGFAGSVSSGTGPLSDLRYRQVRLDLRFSVRMRARQAPLPPITADCHRLLPAIIVAWEMSRCMATNISDNGCSGLD